MNFRRSWRVGRARLARIQEAKKALETQALEAARAEEARRDAKDEACRAAGETPRKRKPVDGSQAQSSIRNFTDPESKIMKVSPTRGSINAAMPRRWPTKSRSSSRLM